MEEVYFNINGKDAYREWGVFMADGALSALMTPAAAKANVESECALEDGKRVVVIDPRVQARDVSLTLYLRAPSAEAFFARYASFCEELAKGWLHIETRFQPGVVYHCVYQSCAQFTQYDGRLATFGLRLNEPNPADRLPR